MRYWWVNQNQTFRHEIEGGYLWSPKRNANGARNPFYESMREVAPGDLVFSFVETRIIAIGIAQSYCWESPKPPEFGAAGENWENIGWKVKVSFAALANKVRPKDHIELLRPLLPHRYSPLQPNGNGLQSIYLTEVPTTLAEVLMGLIGQEIAPLGVPVSTINEPFFDSAGHLVQNNTTIPPLSISGTVANQTESFQNFLANALLHPFSTVAINDGPSRIDTVTITSTPSFPFSPGHLFDPHAFTDGSTNHGNVYKVTGSAAAVTAALQGLDFIGGIGTTHFQIQVNDDAGATATDTTTSVVGLSFGSLFHLLLHFM
jgi:hypothetical protein